MKKGFTLIELLAVILILGIIALIAIPTVNNILKEARIGAFKSSMQNIEKAAQEKCLTEKMKGNTISQFVIADGKISPSLDIKGKIPENGVISLDNECNANSIITNDQYIYSSNEKENNAEECTSTSCVFKGDIKEDDEKYKCFNFDETTGTILKYNGTEEGCKGNVYIPSKINGVPVVKINALAFITPDQIICKKNGVKTTYDSTYIPKDEDGECYGSGFTTRSTYSTVNLEDAGYLTSIEDNAFYYTDIQELKFNDNLKKIGYYAFSQNNIESVTLPKNLVEMEEGAFEEAGVVNLVINNKLKIIPEYAFSFCNIPLINIPEGVEEVDDGAFAWGNYSGGNTVINISDTVKRINYIAFMEVGAVEINFGKNVEFIGAYSFDSNLLTNITLPTKLKTLEPAAFTNNKFPAGNDFIYNLNSDGSTNTKSLNSYGGISDSITIPATIEELGESSVRYAGATSITLNNGLKYIREGALDGNNLTSITIPSTVEIIEKEGINKRNRGNQSLTTIVNKTGRSFDWSSITGSLTPNQNFETGTISHNYGNINVTK